MFVAFDVVTDMKNRIDPFYSLAGGKAKGLPKLNHTISLTKYKYHIKETTAVRQKALRDAIKEYGTLKVLRRLNLIRNYQSNPKIKKRFDKDVLYVEMLYEKVKKTQESK